MAGLLFVLASAAGAQPASECADCFTVAEAREDLRVLYERLQEEHVDLYARRSKAEYAAHVAALVARIEGPIPKARLHKMVHEAVAFGNVGHARTEVAMADVFAHVGEGGEIIPLSVVYHDETMITDNWTGNGTALPPGSAVTSLGGMSVAEFEAQARKIISADTERLLRAQIELGLPAYLYLVFGPRDALRVDYIAPGGTAATHDVAAMPLGEMYALQDSRAVPRPDRDPSVRVYRDLGDGLFYLQPGPFSATSDERGEDGEAYEIGPFRQFVTEAFAALAGSGARDLILDLRGNGGGDASFSDLIIARLSDKPYRYSSRYEIRAGPNTKAAWVGRDQDPDTLSGRIAAALHTAEDGERIAIAVPATPPIAEDAFDGRVWVLVDRHSYSNAAVVAALMQDLGIATVMGEETADIPTTYGAVESFTLPHSGASIVYPKAYMVRPSGSQEVRGVVPDFPIAPDPIGSAHDRMLETAIARIKQTRSADASRPWQTAGPLLPILAEDGTTHSAVRGVWQSRGYGRLLLIDEAGVTQFEIGAACYRPADPGKPLSAMDSLGYRFYSLLPDQSPKPGSAIFQLQRGDTNVVFDRITALPDRCTERPSTTPESVADAFLDAFDRHYAFFDRRPPGHAVRAARVRAAIRPDMSDAELWDALASYMEGLSDSHTKLIGDVDGKRRRVQDGQGTTLPRMRAAEGGETAWLVGLIDGATRRLGDSAHHTGNERIIWGLIDGRVGYLQIFQMGGFTDRDDFGSEAWAAAEMDEFNRIMDEAFAAFADTGVDGVILDLSNNRGGWDKIAKVIPGRFTDEAYVGFTTVTRGSGLAPFPHMIKPAPGPRFTGRVYLLTSDVTVSGGELATLALRQNPRVVHAGTTTRGAFSTPLAKRLPNGWLLELSNETFSAPDGTVYEEAGIAPQIDLSVYDANTPVSGHWQAIETLAGMIVRD